jgi:Transposase-associated domain
MGEDRSWMYNGWKKNGRFSPEWVAGTNAFLDRAFSLSSTGNAQCPCNKCQNFKFFDKDKVGIHLCKFGFVPYYEVWVHHGESATAPLAEEEDSMGVDRMDEMVEAIRPEFNLDTEEPPTAEVEAFFKLLKASEEPLHEHTEVTLLAFVTRLMAIKSKYFFSNNCYNEIVKLICDILPKPHKVPKDMYQSKRLLSSLGMNYEKIDVCPDNCMLF